MKIKTAVSIVALFIALLLLLVFLQFSMEKDTGKSVRIWQHKLYEGYGTDIGTLCVPSDGMVDPSFTTHLPLVVIDTMGKEIVNHKYYDSASDSFREREGEDPYTAMELRIYNSLEHRNHPEGEPELSTVGRIKIRGNTSSSPTFAKKQYLLKLETAEGEKNPTSVLGMATADTWILNGTMIDKSRIRNYIAYNTVGELYPFTPDVRMCEVLLKNGDSYEYLGLYGLYEKIEQGVGKIDIPPISNPIAIGDMSYVLLRDRNSDDGFSMEVYSTLNQRENNWINLEYPSVSKITPEYWDYIQSDIRNIEACLYSDNDSEFLRYRMLLDLESFADYFIFNEFFANYDAGWNSTFLYKKPDGKVAIGPIWDFDSCLDNYNDDLLSIREMAFESSPWFDVMLTDNYFTDLITRRYRMLRETVLSNDALFARMDEAESFLHYPLTRDASRWDGEIPNYLGEHEETGNSLIIARDRRTPGEELQRMKDVCYLHGDYLDKNLGIFLAYFAQGRRAPNSIGGWVVIIAFFASAVLIQRVRKEM